LVIIKKLTGLLDFCVQGHAKWYGLPSQAKDVQSWWHYQCTEYTELRRIMWA
jgi:hypothetical protein